MYSRHVINFIIHSENSIEFFSPVEIKSKFICTQTQNETPERIYMLHVTVQHYRSSITEQCRIAFSSFDFL